LQPLKQALDGSTTRRALLSRTVFMSLYTLGMKAKEAKPQNRELLAKAHAGMIDEYLVRGGPCLE
jgi:hypothetical protein